MKKLPKDWLTDGWVDYEYKKYQMLAYLNEVKWAFQRIELYPSLGELVEHFNHLRKIRDSKDWLKENFPEQLKGITDNKLQYERLSKDDEVMAAIEEIINFAYPKLREALEEGREIYDFVEDHCELSPIGVMPLYADEGYFFVAKDAHAQIYIHQYRITLVPHFREKMRGIHSTIVDTVQRGIGVTMESIKRTLIQKHGELPNPATFLFHSKLNVPEEHTLLPIAKKMVVRYVATNA